MSSSIRRFLPAGAGLALVLSLCASAVAQPEPSPPPTIEAEGAPVDAGGGDAAGAAQAAAPVAPAGPDELAARLEALLGRPGGLTAERVGAQAAATSHEARARAKDVEIAGHDVDRATAGLLPEVTLIARYTRQAPVDSGSFGLGGGSLVVTDAPAGPLPDGAPLTGVPLDALSFPVLPDQYWLQASLSVPISDYLLRTRFGVDAARGQERAARLHEQAARLQVAADAKLVYFDWVRATLQQVVTEQSLAQSEEQLRLARQSLASGRLSRADVLGAEAQVASAELLVSQAKNLVALAEMRLRTALHDTSGQPYVIGERLPDTPSPDARRPFEELLAEAIARRLELRAVDAGRAALQSASRAQRADELPRLSAFANAYYVNPNQRVFPQEDRFSATWDAGVELVWTPTRLGAARAEARKLAAQAEQRDSEAQQLRDALGVEVMAAHRELQEAAQDLETARRGLVAAAEVLRVRQLQLAYGRTTSVEVTMAETAALRARLAVVNARVNLVVAQVRLDHAVGRDAS
ncbi:MAG TPA: TolC family protein [Polyangiaceae bacterium]|nr:TolC family protein [Polyangiaceae bacterium]